MMKKYILLYAMAGILLNTFCGCSDKNKDAYAMLEKATALFDNEELMAAKNELDTIRARFSDNPEILKAALVLTWKVEWKETVRNIAYCDSVLPLRSGEAEKLKPGFVLEKDEKYQETGNYVRKSQVLEKNVERSYIRCGVSEKGEMYIASVYYGIAPLNHTGATFSIPSGISAATASIPYDGGVNYRFKDLGHIYEIVNYKGDKGSEAVKFIYMNLKEKIKVEYTGGRHYEIYMDERSKKTIAETYEFAAILGDMDRLGREREMSMKKKTYLDGKLGL
jgi:hypothetical protein